MLSEDFFLFFGSIITFKSEESTGFFNGTIVNSIASPRSAKPHKSFAVQLVGEGENLEKDFIVHTRNIGPPMALFLVILRFLVGTKHFLKVIAAFFLL